MHRHALMIVLFAGSVCHAQQDDLAQCLAKLGDDARFAPIAGKLALGGAANASPSMRADTGFPQEREMKVIADWAAARGECIKDANRSGNAMYRPPVQAIAIDAENKVLAASVVLHDRKMSYGEFNRERQVIADEMRGKLAALSRQIQTQRSAQEQADQQSRERAEMQKELEEAERRAAAARADRTYRPRAPSSAPARAYGECFRFGGRVFCTTR